MGSLAPTSRAASEHETLVFKLGGSSFGIEMARVRGVVKMHEVTPCAREGSAVCGLVTVKGHRVPVYDLSALLHAQRSKPTSKSRIVLTEGEHGVAAFVVDSVTRVESRQAHAVVAMSEDWTPLPEIDPAQISTF